MADSSAPAAPAPPTEAVANLHLDEVTGEMISKTEKKKRDKQRAKEADKATKAANAPPKAASKPKNSAGEEEDLNPNQYHEIRSRAVNELMKNPETNPYPHKFHVTYDDSKFHDEFKDLKPGETLKDKEITVAGRIYTVRTLSSKLIFYDIRTSADTVSIGTHIQVVCQAQLAKEGGVAFEKQHEHLRRGDIIGITGYPGRTNPKKGDGETGTLSLFASEITLLSPCLHMLPSVRFPFADGEQRARMRYLDLLWNDRSREILWQRSKMVRFIRDFFHERRFIEVETPMMHAIAGGATALPFVTHHNDLDIDMYMRVAPELFLKKMIVGQFGKVFELGKNFRNEGVDLTHNPEFTSCEFYWAYADVHDVMTLTEELVSSLVKELTGSYKTKFTTQHGEEYEVNWEAPWRRIEMIPELERVTGEKFPPYDELEKPHAKEFLEKLCKKMNVDCPPPLTTARMIDKLTGEFIENQCVNPTFITEHPQVMSPLAKYHRTKKGLCERFEAFVCKKEIANAYTELNDPFDQRVRFMEQANQKEQGDDEAQLVDESFLNALEYGLPPTGGWGLGIDRLAMFITNNYSIREVLAFPFLREEKQNNSKEKFAAEIVNVEPLATEGIPHK